MVLPNQIRNSVRRQADEVLTTGNRLKRFDQIRQRHFWSNQLLVPDAAGYVPSGTRKLFITPPGQQGQGYPIQLTDLETNWKSAGRVPDNQNFEVLELGVSLSPVPLMFGTATPLTYPLEHMTLPIGAQNAFFHNTVLAIQYLTNEVSLGLAQDFAQAAGPTGGGYQPATGVNGDNLSPVPRYATNGFASPGLRRRLKIPILLQHGETFSFNLNVPRSFNMGGFGFDGNPPPAGTVIGYPVRIDFWATESFVEKS